MKSDGKIFLFDFDGTLTKSIHFYMKTFLIILKIHKIYPKISEIRKILKESFFNLKKNENSILNYMINVYFCTCKQYRINRIISTYIVIITLLYAKFNYHPEIRISIMKFAHELTDKNYKVGIISLTRRNYVLPFLKSHGIIQNFELILTREDLRHGKSRGIQKLARENNLPINSISYIGDLPGDVYSCLLTGIKPYFCPQLKILKHEYADHFRFWIEE